MQHEAPENVIPPTLWPRLPDNYNRRQYALLSQAVLAELSELDRYHSQPLANQKALDILKAVTPSAGMTRLTLTENISDKHTDLRQNQRAVEDIARVLVWCWTMVDLRSNLTTPDEPSWGNDQSLQEAVTCVFQQLRDSSNTYPSREVDQDLSAAMLEHYQNVRIKWTSVITEHLQLTMGKDSITLSVFEHKIWVKNQLEGTAGDRCPLPRDILEELMLTFVLLFPNDTETEELLTRCGRETSILALGYCGHDRLLKLGRYKYWRARIAALDELLNGPQRGFRQVWRLGKGKENLMNVIIFWMSGVAVLILTVVSSVCGIWSLRVAHHQVEQADAAYKLAVAQACADPNVSDKLAEYCR